MDAKEDHIRDPITTSDWYCWQCKPRDVTMSVRGSAWSKYEKKALLSLILYKEAKDWRQCGELWDYFEHCLRHEFNVFRDAGACRLQLQHNIIGRRSQPDAKIEKTYGELFDSFGKRNVLQDIRGHAGGPRNSAHQCQPPAVPDWAPLHAAPSTASISRAKSASAKRAVVGSQRARPSTNTQPKTKKSPTKAHSPGLSADTPVNMTLDQTTFPQQKRKASIQSQSDGTPTTKKARLDITVDDIEQSWYETIMQYANLGDFAF